MFGSDPVEKALERWERKGLVDPATAAALRAEAEEEAVRAGRRLSRYALAAAGGLVLLVAAGVLADFLWPLLDRSLRSVVLAAAGIAVHGLGVLLERRSRWLPAAWTLQSAGLLILLGAFLHSERSWPDVTLGGVAVGVVALVTPLLTAPRAFLGPSPVMPAVHVALAPAFLAVFLDRATPLGPDAITWTVDAFVLATGIVLLAELRRAYLRGRSGDALHARLAAFTTALYAGLVMAVVTAIGPLDLGGDAVWAADAWWVGVTALVLWAEHGTADLPGRSWYRGQLAVSVLLAIPLVPFTCDVALGWEYAATSLTLALVGAAALTYGTRTGADGVVKAGAVVVVVAAWNYGVRAGGALGAVLALLFTAALLLWLSTRIGGDEGE